jgi:hypothetical protein
LGKKLLFIFFTATEAVPSVIKKTWEPTKKISFDDDDEDDEDDEDD